MTFLLKWLISTLAVIITAYLLPGVSVRSFWTALLVALVLGIINAIIRPIFVVLTLPLTVVTLGLFLFVINAVLILLTSAVVPGFEVRGFWWALLFSLVLSVISWALHKIFAA
jgi:putative membrane protein